MKIGIVCQKTDSRVVYAINNGLRIGRNTQRIKDFIILIKLFRFHPKGIAGKVVAENLMKKIQ